MFCFISPRNDRTMYLNKNSRIDSRGGRSVYIDEFEKSNSSSSNKLSVTPLILLRPYTYL